MNFSYSFIKNKLELYFKKQNTKEGNLIKKLMDFERLKFIEGMTISNNFQKISKTIS